MELRGYLHALRVRWLLVVALTVLGAVAGLGAYLLTPPVYASSVTFYVSTPPADAANAASATQYAQSKVNSYVALLRSDEAARRVIADQRLDGTPAQVAATVSSSAQLNTLLVTATVRDGSAARSLAVARGLADTFGPLVDELDNGGRQADAVGIDVVSGPTLAASPVSPSLTRFAGIGLLIGLLVGLLLAVLRDLLDVTVRTPEAAAEAVGAPTLAVVEDDPDAAARSEAVRQLRTNLAFLGAAAPDDRGAQVVVVTSAVAGEGKTTTALDLARAVAGTGDRVLLVEADLRRPGLAAALGLPPGPGLSDVLAGTAPVDGAVRTGAADGPSVLPAGTVPPNPAELLGSARMGDLLAKLRTEHDLVLLDVPPVLPVTDAAVCAVAADGALLVVRWGRTRRQDVAEAAGMLDQVGARVLGGVLNGRRLTRAERRRYSAEVEPSRA